MAASCEHGTARIKVQVIATLLPLNISLHVDPFWSFIRFSESPTIRDVENKIVVCLNCMGKEYPAELVVHDSPITPAWTYLPPSSPVQSVHSGTHSHKVTLSKSNISDASVSEQQLTIVLRPFSRRIGPWIHKPPKPVLMSYEISHYLPKSARLIFKTQLVFMHDCVLLSGSKSDILMDNDVVTVHAICYFCFVKDDGTSESQRCKQVRVAPEDEFESNGSLGDLDEDSLFCDTETQIRTNTEAKLPSEIRTKIDNLLKKLASLQHSNLNEKSATDCKKSKKRKAEEEDSRSELSKRCLAVSHRNDVQVEEKRKAEESDIRSELSNRLLAVSDRNDVQVEEKRKAEERDIRSELSSRVLAVSDRNDVEVEEKRKADERDIRSELSNRVSGRTDAPSEDKKKVDHGDDDSLLSNSFIATLDRRSIESEKQQTKSVDHIWTHEQNSVNDETSADNLLSKSKKKKKKKHNKKMKYDVEVDSLMDTSVTQTTDVIKQTLQACFYVNDKHNDLVQVDSAANMAVPPAPSTARGRKRKPRNPSDYAVSSLLCVLRKQQTHEINRRGGKDKSQINSQKVEKQRNENTVSEKTDVSFHDASDQLNSSVVSPKRKRIRKRKQKNVNLDKHTSVENISKIIVRDYTLKLPEHQMPKNSRVTFECESDGDEDATSAGQTVEEDMQSVSSANLDEHPPNENNVAESTIQLCSQPEEEHKSAYQRIARSDITKTSRLNVAGAPINPDEKFQALLNQCGRTGRQFETINSANGHTVIRSSRKKHITHAGLSALAATGDLEEDVLTNVSIVLQNSSEAKTPTSNSSSLVQCFPTEVGDNMSNLSHLSNDKLNTRSLITSIPDLKPVQTLVEVTPLYMNYSSCTELCGLPKESDIIAYKILEMAEDYTPGLSNFKEAKVIQVDAQTGHLLLEHRGGKDNKKRLGRFEINFNDNKETGSTGDEELVATNLTDLVDARLVFRADGSQ